MLLIRVLIFLLLSTTTISADTINYWSIEIPALDSATDVVNEKNERFYLMNLTYEVQIQNPQEVYSYYDAFFEKQNWKNPLKHLPVSKNQYQGKWSSYRSTFTSEGLPESSYASMWKANDFPAVGSVTLTLLDFKDGIYSAKVNVVLAPEIDMSPLMKLHEIMTGDPKSIFILHEATGGNPFQLETINVVPPASYMNISVVKDYYEVVNIIMKRFEEFGQKYVH